MSKPEDKHVLELKYYSTNKAWGLSKGGITKMAPEDFPPIKIKYGYAGEITFKIVESPGVTFAPTNPILAAKVTVPPSKPTGLDPQFTIDPASTSTVLIVDDLNAVPGKPHQGYDKTDFNYVLNFVNADPVDPVISNGGCCKPTGSSVTEFFASTAGMITIVSLVVILIVALLLRQRRTAG